MSQVLLVDVANVMGSRPDGWWRDRSGAATRLMASLVPLVGVDVPAPGAGGRAAGPAADPAEGPACLADAPGATVRVDLIVAVVEGRARTAIAPDELEVMLAPADGDTTIVQVAEQVLARGDVPLVVTADRGLRDRLPPGARFAGPSWLLDLL